MRLQDMSVDRSHMFGAVKCKATDDRDGDVEMDCSEEKSDFDADRKYTLTRTYTAPDDRGNTTSVVQMITVWCPKACNDDNALTAKMDVNATPNPFREESMIAFTPIASGKAVVEITDLQGRKVAELYNGQVELDVPVKLAFRPAENSSGIFIYRITLNGEVVQGRMLFQP